MWSWLGFFVKWKWKLLSCVRLLVIPWTIQFMEFSRPEYWSGYSFTSPGDLPNPGIEPTSPILQADSWPAEPQGKPKNIGVGSLSLLQWSSQPRNWARVSCIAGGFFISWADKEGSYEGSLIAHKFFLTSPYFSLPSCKMRLMLKVIIEPTS